MVEKIVHTTDIDIYTQNMIHTANISSRSLGGFLAMPLLSQSNTLDADAGVVVPIRWLQSALIPFITALHVSINLPHK